MRGVNERKSLDLQARETTVARLEAELAAVKLAVEAEKRRKAAEARANAKSELHRQMFAVADGLGGKYYARDASGEVRFQAQDLCMQ